MPNPSTRRCRVLPAKTNQTEPSDKSPLSRLWGALVVCVATVLIAGVALGGPPAHAEASPYKVLVFSKTGVCHHHDSIPAGVAAIQKLGSLNGFTVEATEDATNFTDANLAQYATVVFLSTQCDPLGTQAQKDAFQSYIRNGGGFVGVHASIADPNYPWPWYDALVGASFSGHPAIQPATMNIEDDAHPATNGLPTQFSRSDEWYDFTSNPRSRVHVLTSVDTSSYSGWQMGPDHPLTWCQDYDGGRSFYTALGHDSSAFSESNVLQLLLGGIQTTAGAVTADCTVPPARDGELVGPMPGGAINMSVSSTGTVIAVAPDKRVWKWDGSGWTEILGKLLERATVRTPAVGQDEIWGSATDGTIWRRTGTSWAKIAGDGTDVAIANGDGTVWRTDVTGTYKWTGGTSTTDAAANWTLVSGSVRKGIARFVQVSGKSDSDLWGVSSNNTVWHYGGAKWSRVKGSLKWVSEAADGTVIGASADNKVFIYTGKRWIERPGPLAQLSVGSATNMWGVDSSNRIFKTIN